MSESKGVNCVAHSCPMLGTSSRNTTGGDWCCFIHAGSEASRWQSITAELNRLSWMVHIVRDIRALGLGQTPFSEILTNARKQFISAQRSDLLMQEREEPTAWMIRLEAVLAESCRVQRQNEIPIEEPTR